jgi:ankyrin repeat protein
LLLKHGIDLNAIGADHLTPLQIAVIMNQEGMVEFLVQQGAIDEQFQGNMDKIFEMESFYKNRNIVDLLIRGATLCDSIHNSSSITDHVSWNEQDEQEELSYFQLNEICNEILMHEFEQNED